MAQRLTKAKSKRRTLPPSHRYAEDPWNRPCSDRDNAVLDYYFANGFRKKQAMRESGFFAASTCANTGQFFNRPHIVREIQRRRSHMKDKILIDEDSVLQQYARIAFSDIGDLLVPDEDNPGEFMLDLDLMTEHMKSAISEFVVEERTEGRGEDKTKVRKLRLKTHSKTEALQALGKYLGIFQDAMAVVTDVQLSEALAAGRQRMKRPPTLDAEFEEVPSLERPKPQRKTRPLEEVA